MRRSWISRGFFGALAVFSSSSSSFSGSNNSSRGNNTPPLAAVALDIPAVLVTSHARPLAELPAPLQHNVVAWTTANPTFAFRYFDDAAQAEFMRAHCAAPRCLDAYGLLVSGAARADMFRVAFMYYAGGWWFDADLKAGSISTQCDVRAAPTDARLFLVKEPRRGHVRYMIAGGHRHPFLLATLYRQIHNVIEAKTEERREASAPPRRRNARPKGPKASAQALMVTGPFTLGHAICDPVQHADLETLVPDAAATTTAAVESELRDIASHCDPVSGLFDGRIEGRPPPGDKDLSWNVTFGTDKFLFHFDVCRGYWHRPGARNLVYRAALAEMNVSHHTVLPA